MKVLSLFDGISCGMVALERAGIKVDKYYASEIDKNAIKISEKNYPQIIRLGDVTKWKEWDIDWSSVDLLMGGSPCQGFSIAGKKLNFQDDRSKLFFHFVDILCHIQSYNPNIKFLLENVRMPDNIADKIDELLQVKRVFLNSKDFTGMIRKRYYWTNIPVHNVLEKDICLEELIDKTIPFDKSLDYLLSKTKYAPTTSGDGIITINPKDNNNKQTWQRGRVYDIRGKCPTICATLFDLNITNDHKTYRKLVIEECEKLQGIPKGYTSGVSKIEAGKMLGNGWTVDVIVHILSQIPMEDR